MSRQREALWEYERGALWVLPGLAVMAALLLGGLLSSISVPNRSVLHYLVFEGTSDDARNLLIGITGTIVTVIALVLGLMVVALTLSSTQFSPRLLRNFLRDRPNKLVLSAFVATFSYSAAGLYTVGVSAGSRSVNFPRLAVTGAILLLFVSLFALVYQVHHVSHSMQLDEIMRRVQNETQSVLRHQRVRPCDTPAPVRPPWAKEVSATRSGYVQTVHAERLIALADRLRMHVAVIPRIGDHVVSGSPLAWVWRDDPADALDDVHLHDGAHHTVRLGFEPTSEQDVAFGLRQLVDIASKVLSPAVNDPYTGVQAVNHLAVVMATIARRSHGTTVHEGPGGGSVTVPGWTFADYLDLTCAQIRRYGASEPTVIRELISLLSSTAHLTDDPARRAEILRQLDLMVSDAERAIAQPADLIDICAAAKDLRDRLAVAQSPHTAPDPPPTVAANSPALPPR